MADIKDLIVEHGDKVVGNPAKVLDQVFAYTTTADKKYKLGDVSLGLGFEAGGDVLLINEGNKGDAALDSECVFDLPRAVDKDEFEFLDFKPVIKFDTTNAWFRYRLFANAKLNGSSSASYVGISLDANAETSVCSYKKHNKDESIKDAITENILRDVPMLLSQGVFDSLEVGEAVSYRVAGGLNVGATLNLADILSGAIAGSGVFSGLIGASYTAGVSVGVDATITDEFLLIIARKDTTRFDVVIRKSQARTLGASATLGVDVKIDESGLIQLANEALAAVAEQGVDVIEKAFKELDKIVKSGEQDVAKALDQLDDSIKQALDTLLPKLRAAPFESLSELLEGAEEDLLEKVTDLQESLVGVIKILTDSIKDEGGNSMKLAIEYEYSRVNSSRDVLRFNCTKQILNRIRKDLLRMDLTTVKKEIESAESSGSNEIELVNYLREQSLTVQHTFGVGLFLFGWGFATTRTSRVRQNLLQDLSVKSPSPIPVLRVAFESIKSATQTSTREKEKYSVSFGAHSVDNAESPSGPRTAELSYTLGSAALYESKKLKSAADLVEYVDTGMLFGALGQGSASNIADELYVKLKRAMKKNTKVSIATGVTVKGALAKEVIQEMATNDVNRLGRALARSMSWLEDFEVRRSVISRESHYTALFEEYLKEDHSNAMWRQKVRAHFNPIDSKLEYFERTYADGKTTTNPRTKGTYADYYLGVINLGSFKGSVSTGKLHHSDNDRLRDGVQGLGSATSLLATSWNASRSYEILKDEIHKPLLKLFRNEYSGRFYGAYLNLLVQELGVLKNSSEFEQQFRVVFTNKKGKEDSFDFVSA